MAMTNRSNDDNLLVALRHPLRRRILRELAIEEDPLSPRELADTLHAPLTNVAYHVRVLADCAAVVLVRTQPAGGSMQHFYSSAVEAPWARQILGLDENENDEGGESPGSAST
jgi:DNA-binding transcriptional ArsR family regulator